MRQIGDFPAKKTQGAAALSRARGSRARSRCAGTSPLNELDIVTQIDLAALGDSSLSTEVDAAKKRLRTIEEDAAKVVSDADAYKKAIAVAAAAAARAKAERDAARAQREAERWDRLPK